MNALSPYCLGHRTNDRAGASVDAMRRWCSRLAALGLGCVAAILLLEAGLQLAGVVLRRFASRSEVQAVAAGRTVLCVGDSHTWGTTVPREGAYPSQLREYLDGVDPEGRYRVVNRGVPGMNSAQVAHEIPGLLEAEDPDLVVVWVGVNNAWNRDDPLGGAGEGLGDWLARSRLYRLLRVLGEESQTHDSPGDDDAAVRRIRAASLKWMGKGRRVGTEFLEKTVADLEHIAATLRSAGRPWMLVTYPLEGYERGRPRGDPSDRVDLEREASGQSYRAANLQGEAVRRVASRDGVLVVHTREDLRRARRVHPEASLVCERSQPGWDSCLFVNAAGAHPTSLLYGFIAESIGGRMLDLLGCAGPCH